MTAATVKTPRALENNQVFNNRSRGRSSYVAQGRNHGGARKGAGRKAGATTTKTRVIADRLAKDGGLMPLEYLVGVMRTTPADIKAKFNRGEIDHVQYAVELSELQRRRDHAAQVCLPFFHPKLASIQATVSTDQQAEWLELIDSMEK